MVKKYSIAFLDADALKELNFVLYFYQLSSNLVHIICQFYHHEGYLMVEILISFHMTFTGVELFE